MIYKKSKKCHLGSLKARMSMVDNQMCAVRSAEVRKTVKEVRLLDEIKCKNEDTRLYIRMHMTWEVGQCQCSKCDFTALQLTILIPRDLLVLLLTLVGSLYQQVWAGEWGTSANVKGQVTWEVKLLSRRWAVGRDSSGLLLPHQFCVTVKWEN